MTTKTDIKHRLKMKGKVLVWIALWIWSIPVWGQSDEILRVLSFNIRYDNPNDGINNWSNRKEKVARVITDSKAHIIGLQEVLHHQLVELKQLLPSYGAIGVGRTDGKEKGEYCTILYDQERCTPIQNGHFWLSPTPDVVGSKGWDAALERMASWIKLIDKGNGDTLLVVNTHLDHVGEMARRESVRLLLKRISTLRQGARVILTGDFNASLESEVVRSVEQTYSPQGLKQTRSIAEHLSGPKWSFHQFGKLPIHERTLIDHIFVSQDWEVKGYSVLSEDEGDTFYSDHCAILVRLLPMRQVVLRCL